MRPEELVELPLPNLGNPPFVIHRGTAPLYQVSHVHRDVRGNRGTVVKLLDSSYIYTCTDI